MFERTDRILVAVRDLDQATANYHAILGAVASNEHHSTLLRARVRTLQLGNSEVELCQPDGPGRILRHLDAFGEGLYCGGVSVRDLDACRKTLARNHISYEEEGKRVYPDPADMYGLALAISGENGIKSPPAPGPVDYLYEITQVLDTRWQIVANHYSEKLNLDATNFVGITFPRFGYEGVLMKFSDDRLDRIELSEAHDPAFPMGRFTQKRGDALYMCYVETNDLSEIIERLESRGQKWTRRTTTPFEQDGLWIHPGALNGVLMGVSRRTLAWGWSGKPEQVKQLEGNETA